VCISAEVDVVAGALVVAVGVDAWRHVRDPGDRLLAAIPTVLGAHLLVEAFVWWGLDGTVPGDVGRLATWAYLLVAFVVLPVLVPLAIARAEPDNRSHRGFLVLGILVAAVLLAQLVMGGVGAAAAAHHVAYDLEILHGGVTVGFYVVATCGPMLVSRRRWFQAFGAVNLGVVVALAWVTTSGLVSLWCGWAALTSVAVATHLRRPAAAPGSPTRSAGRRSAPGGTGPPAGSLAAEQVPPHGGRAEGSTGS
jgi:hypothetical protein